MNSLQPKLSKIVLTLLCGSVILAAGCSSKPQTGTVTGTVKYDGKPYSNAGVMFLSLETGNGSGGDIQPDGSYSQADPIVVGTYTVYLAPKAPDLKPGEQPPAAYMDKTVPEKYWSEASSDIKIDVKEGPNVVPLDIKR